MHFHFDTEPYTDETMVDICAKVAEHQVKCGCNCDICVSLDAGPMVIGIDSAGNADMYEIGQVAVQHRKHCMSRRMN